MKKLLLVVAFLPSLIQAETNIQTSTMTENVPHVEQAQEPQLTQAQLEQLILEQQAALEYYERQMRLQQYFMMRSIAYPVPVRHYNSGISQQIGNMKYNFNSNGVSTEQTIGNKTFTNGQTR